MSSRVNEVDGENLQDPPQSKVLATPMSVPIDFFLVLFRYFSVYCLQFRAVD